MGGFGNGNGARRRQFVVRPTPHYNGCRAAFEVRNPAVAEERVLEFLALRLALDPRDIARQLSDMTWVTRTEPGQNLRGDEIPGATIYFTIAGDTVYLHRLVGDDELEDNG